MKPIAFILLILIACTAPDKTNVAYTGATIIDGSGTDVIKDGVLIIKGGKIAEVGTRDEVKIPGGVKVIDVTGKFIMPGIINTHGHVGDVKGIDGGNYSKENIAENLSLYAKYGVTTVVSLGGDKAEAESYRTVNDTSMSPRARLYIAGEIVTGATPEEGVAVVEKNHKMGVDFIKIRVDDNLGTATKIPEEVYRAAIKKSHDLGYKVATHMYYLDDARKLLEAGTNLMAHSVRDQTVDVAFSSMMKLKNVGYCPTLTRDLSTFVYSETPDFFSDPFFTRQFDSAMLKPLMDPARQKQVRESKSAITYRQQLPTAMSNLKELSDAGVIICFGTDSGVPTRFMGYFEHLEMSMMADAGLTPMQIIQSASKNPAELLGLKDLGTLTEGHWADFIVLDADPLMDIKNTRRINRVFVGGTEVK